MTTASLPSTTWEYTTANGMIYSPDGSQFVAHGINVMYNNDGWNPTAAQILNAFPDTNIIRLAVYNYDSPQSMQAYVKSMTAAGMVVEIENHNNGAGNAGGATGTIFTGAMLQQEQAWYQDIATFFGPNGTDPDSKVWFGTNNEPSETNANGNSDPAALSAWQQMTYDTIRATGNPDPILLEANGWTNNGAPVMLQGYNAANYAGMTNTIWDEHYYGWLTNYSPDQSANDAFLQQMTAQSNQITGAGGEIMPVIDGEFGNSTIGTSRDLNGDQVMQTVTQAADKGVTSGYMAWAWGQGNPYDGLTDANNNPSAAMGQYVASAMRTTAASFPANVPVQAAAPTALAALTAAALTVAVASVPIVTDAKGGNWTITGTGTVDLNGTAAGYSANVVRLADVGGVAWQENAAGGWWGWDGSKWGLGNGTTTSPMPAASANDTVIKGATGTVTDASGNAWSISQNGTVTENGVAAGYSANVTELAYVNNIVWQENKTGGWWGWNNTGWTVGNGTMASPLPTPPAVQVTNAAGVTQSVATVAATPVVVDGDSFTLKGGAIQAKFGPAATKVTFLGSTNVTVTAGAGTATVTAAAGSNTFVASKGLLNVTGGAGADNYVFHAGSGLVTIADFSAAKGDMLTIDKKLKTLLTQASDGHGGTMLGFSGHSGFDLQNVTTVPTTAIHFA